MSAVAPLAFTLSSLVALANPSGADVDSSLHAALTKRDTDRAARVAACLAAKLEACNAALPSLGVDDATLTRVLKTAKRDWHLQSSLARAVLEDALAKDAQSRFARRRSLTFVDAGAVFALDDVGAVLHQENRTDRARILGATRLALEHGHAIDEEELAIVDAVAARAGLARNDLLARRIGLDANTLTKLAKTTLAATAALIGPIASDVTLVPDVVIASKLDPADAHVDEPLLAAATANATWLLQHAREPNAVRFYVVELRRLALAVGASLSNHGVDDADSFASRILDGDATSLRGASAFLPRLAGGALVDQLAAALMAPSIAQRMASGDWKPADVEKKWRDVPPLDEQGFPEALVGPLKVLPELAR